MKNKLIVNVMTTSDSLFAVTSGNRLHEFTKPLELAKLEKALKEMGYDAQLEFSAGIRYSARSNGTAYVYQMMYNKKYVLHATLTVEKSLRVKTFAKARKLLDNTDYKYHFE